MSITFLKYFSEGGEQSCVKIKASLYTSKLPQLTVVFGILNAGTSVESFVNKVL